MATVTVTEKAPVAPRPRASAEAAAGAAVGRRCALRCGVGWSLGGLRKTGSRYLVQAAPIASCTADRGQCARGAWLPRAR